MNVPEVKNKIKWFFKLEVEKVGKEYKKMIEWMVCKIKYIKWLVSRKQMLCDWYLDWPIKV